MLPLNSLKASFNCIIPYPVSSTLQGAENIKMMRGYCHIINNSFVNVESSYNRNGTEYQRSPCKVVAMCDDSFSCRELTKLNYSEFPTGSNQRIEKRQS